MNNCTYDFVYFYSRLLYFWITVGLRNGEPCEIMNVLTNNNYDSFLDKINVTWRNNSILDLHIQLYLFLLF